MVVYLKPSLGLIQDGDTGFPQGEWLLGAIPKLPWGGQKYVFKRQDLGPRPQQGTGLGGDRQLWGGLIGPWGLASLAR